MRRSIASISLTLVAAAGATVAVPAQVAAQDAISLFNGTDLTGWTVHGTERWYVENGELVGESGPDAGYGYLATEASFKDFELTVEFLQEANGNSGVFVRSHVDGTRVSGWQVEVAPPGRFTGGIYESYGRGWLIQPDLGKDTALRMGEWNTMHIRVVGDRVTSWLNGVEMVDLVDEQIGRAEGHIALQIHDGGGIKVRWRNLRLVAR
ncbi:MAG: secreted glycosyl hydrolase [Gemmatimonas sp. SG8_28]|nr:MAG: secreted glycosyl hydrolase [Gemmatimonas sp. SG8_28]